MSIHKSMHKKLPIVSFALHNDVLAILVNVPIINGKAIDATKKMIEQKIMQVMHSDVLEM